LLLISVLVTFYTKAVRIPRN